MWRRWSTPGSIGAKVRRWLTMPPTAPLSVELDWQGGRTPATPVTLGVLTTFDVAPAVPGGFIAPQQAASPGDTIEHECEECFELSAVFSGRTWLEVGPDAIDAHCDYIVWLLQTIYRDVAAIDRVGARRCDKHDNIRDLLSVPSPPSRVGHSRRSNPGWRYGSGPSRCAAFATSCRRNGVKATTVLRFKKVFGFPC